MVKPNDTENSLRKKRLRNNETYAQRYGMEPSDYVGIELFDKGLSDRTENLLMQYEITDMQTLLQQTRCKLADLQGVGRATMRELDAFIETARKAGDGKAEKEDIRDTRPLLIYKAQMLSGDFSFLESAELSPELEELVRRFEEAYRVLDPDLIRSAIEKKAQVLQISRVFLEFMIESEMLAWHKFYFAELPAWRASASMDTILNLVIQGETDPVIESVMRGRDETFSKFVWRNRALIQAGHARFLSFLEQCHFDTAAEIHSFFENVPRNERQKSVFTDRAKRIKLDQIAKRLGLTRERVRQIEVQIQDKFSAWTTRNQIVLKLFYDMGEDTGLSGDEIRKWVGAYGLEFSYALQNEETDLLEYDAQMDFYLLKDSERLKCTRRFAGELQNTISRENMEKEIRRGVAEYDCSEKVLRAIIRRDYRQTGETYHRAALLLSNVYSGVLKKYYPGGIHLDKKEIDRFRQLVKREYGVDISGKSQHAVSSRLTQIGILCGRGKYKYRGEEPLISGELQKKICDYVEASSDEIFLTNTLFCVFEDELLQEGIDNRYYLQAVLHECFGDRWYFRRDYVSKSQNQTSIYKTVVDYIKSAEGTVSKEELFNAFPGMTEIVLSFAVSDPDVINLYGDYVHVSKLRITKRDRSYFQKTLKQFLKKGEGVCGCGEMFDCCRKECPDLLEKNYIRNKFSLYSLLNHLFGDTYTFERPFIFEGEVAARQGREILRSIVQNADVTPVSAVTEFVREHQFTLYSILEFINTCNDSHLLMDGENLAAISYIGINEEMTGEIEKMILKELPAASRYATPIVYLRCVKKFPEIRVPWNAWLIYSALYKWGKCLTVTTSGNKFWTSYALVARNDMELEELPGNPGLDHSGRMMYLPK